MIRALFIAMLLVATSVQGQDDSVHYADATREKALVDEYLVSYTAEAKPLVVERKLLNRLFGSYDGEVYQQTLVYLQSLLAEQPEAVLALSDSIQAYWDSHYLQSFISGTSAEYGKLKFLFSSGDGRGWHRPTQEPTGSF